MSLREQGGVAPGRAIDGTPGRAPGGAPGHAPGKARRGRSDEGSAIVEFLGMALLLLVPVVYLVLALGRVQAATFAADGAAREAARAVVTARDDASATERGLAAVRLAFDDQGIAIRPAEVLSVRCDPACTAPGGVVTVAVEVDVTLPGVPAWLDRVIPLHVPVSATTTATVDTHVGVD